MHWLTKTKGFWDECAALSRGTSGKNRIKPGLFLTINVPLPSINEQRRIVARIDELAAKIEETRGLRHDVTKQLDSLVVAIAHRNDLDEVVKRQQGWTQVALRDVVTLVQEKHVVNPEEVYPNLGIYSFGRGLFPKPPIQGIATSATSLNRVHAGQFIYSRLFAFEGAYGFVDDEYDGLFVSNEYPTFNCNHDHVIVEFLYAYFKSPSVWREVAVGSKGLGHRRQRVQPEQVLAHRLWLPPLAWQEQIRQIFLKLDSLKPCQAEAAAGLDVLLRSILHRAFRSRPV